MSWHVEVSAIERRFHGNLPRHDGPERLTRTNVDSTSFCYVCVYMLVFTYPLFNHRKDIYIYMLDLLFLSPHAMLTHCGFVFKRIMSRRKVIPVNLVLQSTFFFSIFSMSHWRSPVLKTSGRLSHAVLGGLQMIAAAPRYGWSLQQDSVYAFTGCGRDGEPATWKWCLERRSVWLQHKGSDSKLAAWST